MARKPTDTVIFSLRMREELRRQLEREAKRQERSMNAEIIQRLEGSFHREEERDLAAGLDELRFDLGEQQQKFQAQISDLLKRLNEALARVERDLAEDESK
jgi:Arc-like DNA binding domain